MKSHEYHESAAIEKDSYCKECHFPIVFVCCNDTMQYYAKKKTGYYWDWWLYCSNKGCKNHVGEGIFQNRPDWIYKYDNG